MGHTSPHIGRLLEVLEYCMLHGDILANFLQKRGSYFVLLSHSSFPLTLFQDKEPASEADMSISGVYQTIWSICKLRRVSSVPF
jgi:hypothetical protein